MVQRLLREEERKNDGVHVKTAAFEALQACRARRLGEGEKRGVYMIFFHPLGVPLAT